MLGAMTGKVVCTTCGPLPNAEAHGMGMSVADMAQPDSWRIRVGDFNYMIPWQVFVQHNPPCPHCEMGELTVEDVEIAHLVVQ